MLGLSNYALASAASNPVVTTGTATTNNSGSFWGGLGDVLNTTLTNAANLGGQLLNLELIGEILEEQREAGFATATTQQTAGSTANGLPAPVSTGGGMPEWVPYAGLGLAAILAIVLVMKAID